MRTPLFWIKIAKTGNSLSQLPHSFAKNIYFHVANTMRFYWLVVEPQPVLMGGPFLREPLERKTVRKEKSLLKERPIQMRPLSCLSAHNSDAIMGAMASQITSLISVS